MKELRQARYYCKLALKIDGMVEDWPGYPLDEPVAVA